MPTIALLALEAADGTVVLTSITLVFAMLVALCLIITVEGKLFDALNNKKNPKPAPKKESKPAAAPAAKPAAPAPKTEGGIPGEIIAAISAAVATVVGGNAVIRGIKRIPKNGGSRRGAWGDAGVQEHTTPFM
ncbi:MAG: OadG family transporter subunit [Gemmiger sp.]|nr:OadG family transporter subunit [Gemmiger sp.]